MGDFKLIKSQDIKFGENQNLKQFIEELDKSRQISKIEISKTASPARIECEAVPDLMVVYEK